MADENFIELRGVRKLFGTVAAVEHVDMNIARGAFFSLLGASGCGKTTLLSMLGGLEYPSAGNILIDGADVTRVPPLQTSDEHGLSELCDLSAPERRR